MEDQLHALHRLAEFCRVETSFYDGLGQYRQAGPEVILEVLRSLGAPVLRIEDADSALTEMRRRQLDQVIEPVHVWWEGRPPGVEFVLPAGTEPSGWLRLLCEDGTRHELRIAPESVSVNGETEIGSSRYRDFRCDWELEVPPGYHRLDAEFGSVRKEVLVIAAPERALQPDGRRWGLFLPLYALRTRRSWGVGDFSDLVRLSSWAAELGASAVGTLPLFAAFLDEPFSPSPYTPVSRLFWNELYLDPRRCPSWTAAEVQLLVESSAVQAELTELRSATSLDYRRLAALRRRVLGAMVRATPPPELDSVAAEHPEILDYAEFRGRIETEGPDYRRWVAESHSGQGPRTPAVDYHLYVQWQCRRQLDHVFDRIRRLGAELYLDFPLGVHPDGYDAWRWPDAFAAGVSGGAPPDGFFTEGQDWGFQPLHPERAREDGYHYLRRVLGNLTHYANLVRVDHAMSLQRLYWVPIGMSAKEGVYVHYRTEELLALLVLESSRNGCVVVGEDLGTVTPDFRRLLADHGIQRMYVGQFEFSVDRNPPFHPVPEAVVASLNTHDTPTAAGFWYGDDIEDRVDLGLLDDETAAREREGRRTVRRALMEYLGVHGYDVDPTIQFEVLKGWLQHLAASDAAWVLVTLEDLLQERIPQNVPGTVDQRPNWRRRARLSLEELCSLPRVVDTLQAVDRSRRRGRQAEGES